MVKSSDEPSLLFRIRSIARTSHAHHHSPGAGELRRHSLIGNSDPSDLPVSIVASDKNLRGTDALHDDPTTPVRTQNDTCIEKVSSALPPPAPPPDGTVQEEVSATIDTGGKRNVLVRFCEACKEILLSSWMNVLLVFVPVGIAVEIVGINPNIIFAINAIAIIPLAGLLAHATESVASEMGDTIGALMNVTFGNAVELIILYV
ncbi:MAG: hypothetical protein Q9190_000612 [Brigantiaea leucoxantha]